MFDVCLLTCCDACQRIPPCLDGSESLSCRHIATECDIPAASHRRHQKDPGPAGRRCWTQSHLHTSMSWRKGRMQLTPPQQSECCAADCPCPWQALTADHHSLLQGQLPKHFNKMQQQHKHVLHSSYWFCFKYYLKSSIYVLEHFFSCFDFLCQN